MSLIIFSTALSIVFLKIIKASIENLKTRTNLRKIFFIAAIFQFIIITTGLIILLQISILSEYQTALLILLDTSIKLFSIFVLGILFYQLMKWYKVGRNIANMVLSLGFLTITLAYFFAWIVNLGDLSIKDDLISFANGKEILYNESQFQLYVLNLLDTIDIVAVILLWGGISLLFSYISKSIGNKKYWILISLPIIFYLSHFIMRETIRVNPEDSFYVLLDLIYLVIACILPNTLSFVFYFSTRKTIPKNSHLHTYLMMTIVGFTLANITTFSSLYLATYPPFGTASAIISGISYFLFFIGFYCIISFISFDRNVRSLMYKFDSEKTSFFLENALNYNVEIVDDVRYETIKGKPELDSVQIPMTSSELSDYINNVINIVRDESSKSKSVQEHIIEESVFTSRSEQESNHKVSNIHSLKKPSLSLIINLMIIIFLMSLVLILFHYNENYGLIANPYFGVIISLLILSAVFILHTKDHYFRKIVNRLVGKKSDSK